MTMEPPPSKRARRDVEDPTPSIADILLLLHYAKQRVQRLERRLADISGRTACDHKPVYSPAEGPRDNGELISECARCGRRLA